MSFIKKVKGFILDLVVRLSALGDIIHTAIILQFLPNKVDWLVEGSMAEILEYNPNINKIQKINLKSLKKSKMNVFSEYQKLKPLNYDRSIDFQGLLKSAIVSKLVSNEVIGRDEVREKIAKLFYDKTLKTNNHTIDRYRLMINQIYGLNVSQEEFINHKPFLFYKDNNIKKEYLSQNKKNIVFIIGSSWECKKTPLNIWKKLSVHFKNENILIPYGNDMEEKEAFEIAIDNQNVYPLKLNLNDLKALISNSDLLIGNDTGPSFIAWANNVKNIVLYGCTYNDKIFENEFSKSVEIQKGQINKKLFNMDKMDIKKIIGTIDELF